MTQLFGQLDCIEMLKLTHLFRCFFRYNLVTKVHFNLHLVFIQKKKSYLKPTKNKFASFMNAYQQQAPNFLFKLKNLSLLFWEAYGIIA